MALQPFSIERSVNIKECIIIIYGDILDIAISQWRDEYGGHLPLVDTYVRVVPKEFLKDVLYSENTNNSKFDEFQDLLKGLIDDMLDSLPPNTTIESYLEEQYNKSYCEKIKRGIELKNKLLNKDIDYDTFQNGNNELFGNYETENIRVRTNIINIEDDRKIAFDNLLP